jgi:hypothetical protein
MGGDFFKATPPMGLFGPPRCAKQGSILAKFHLPNIFSQDQMLFSLKLTLTLPRQAIQIKKT